MEALVKDVYYNTESPACFAGIEAVFREAKKRNGKITRKQVEEFLSKQDSYTLHRQRRTRFKRNKTVTAGFDVDWQADLADMRHLKLDELDENSTEWEKKRVEFIKSCFDVSYNALHHRVILSVCENRQLVFSKLLAYMLGFKYNYIEGERTADYEPDLRGGMDSLYVYCDLIEPQIVGDVMEPLLRILPVIGEYGKVIHQVFVAPHYVNVLQKEFSSVRISIKTDQDRPILFRFGKSVVKLHFRQK